MLQSISNPNLKNRVEKIGKIRRKKERQEADQRLLDNLKEKAEDKHRLFIALVEKNLRSMCKKVKFFDFMAALLEEVTHSKDRGFGFGHRICLYFREDKICKADIYLKFDNHFFEFKKADSLELEVELSTKKSDSWLFVETVFPLPEYLLVNGHYGIDKKVVGNMLSILQQLLDPKSAIKFLEKNLPTFTGETIPVDFSFCD